MSKSKYHPLPVRDPVTGGDLYISEVKGEESGIALRGRFAYPRFARLDAEQVRFLETFLRCRGMINSVEKELNISYPTVKARLDALLEALELTPVRDDKAKKERALEKKRKILEQLEQGEITVEEAKQRMRGEEQ